MILFDIILFCELLSILDIPCGILSNQSCFLYISVFPHLWPKAFLITGNVFGRMGVSLNLIIYKCSGIAAAAKMSPASIQEFLFSKAQAVKDSQNFKIDEGRKSENYPSLKFPKEIIKSISFYFVF